MESNTKFRVEIGELIEPIIDFVKDLESQDKKINIFTARATNKVSIPYIQAWLKKNGFPEFEITNTKDFGMTMLYDDRCTKVNTSGIIISKEIGEYNAKLFSQQKLSNKIIKMESTMSKFERMGPEHPLVSNLSQKKWWPYVRQLAKENKDINVQVRSNSLNIYYKMANLLQIVNNDPVANIHYKYLPSIIESSSEYARISFDESGAANLESPVSLIDKDLFSENNLTALLKSIDNFSSEEKKLQSKLIEKNRLYVLDAEMAIPGTQKRIDVVIYDAHDKAIRGVELKRVDDARLYTDEIGQQLQSYTDFFSSNVELIIESYKNSVQTKLKLGLIDKDDDLFSKFLEDQITVEPKPILAIAASNQKLIDMALDNINMNAIKQNAYALYMYGKEPADLCYKSGKNFQQF